MIVGEEIKLIEEVSNIDATERIHLRKWQDTGEALECQHPVNLRTMRCDTDFRFSRSLSGVYQLTPTTLSYSSRLLIGMGM